MRIVVSILLHILAFGALSVQSSPTRHVNLSPFEKVILEATRSKYLSDCPPGETYCGSGCCLAGQYCCGGSLCCTGSCCGSNCCLSGQTCCISQCCLAGETCCGSTCCYSDQNCCGGNTCCSGTCSGSECKSKKEDKRPTMNTANILLEHDPEMKQQEVI